MSKNALICVLALWLGYFVSLQLLHKVRGEGSGSHANTRNSNPLQVKEMVKNFGDTQQGQILNYFIEVTNLSPEPIFDLFVQSSCSCTSIEVPIQILEANSTVKIPVRWDTKHNRGLSFSTINVVGKKGNGHSLESKVLLKVNVKPFLIVTPETITFDLNYYGQEEIKFSLADNKPINFDYITSLSCDHPAVTIDKLANDRFIVKFNCDKWKIDQGMCRIEIKTKSESDSSFFYTVSVLNKPEGGRK